MALVRGGSVVLRTAYRRACLSIVVSVSILRSHPNRVSSCRWELPLGFGGLEGLALRVVAQGPDVDEAAKVELLGPFE